ncbi:MAG: hypothetical protein WCJ71_05095 [Candidatus Omnitrophota bacterium]
MKKKIDPEKIKLTPEEEEYERESDHDRPVSREEFLKIKEAIDQWKKDTVLNMRINGEDVMLLKQKAEKLGVKYQTFIAQILHRVARS